MKNILIVDDEKSFLLTLADGLSSYAVDYNVLTANNGEEAVELLNKVKVDLLLTDLKMPVMDGFALLAYVATMRIQIPIIVMTAFGTPEIEERLNRIGSFQFLEKPLDFNVLADKISSMLIEGVKGHIEGIALSSFLQLVEMDKKTCSLRIKSHGMVGNLYFKTGILIDADAGTLTGEAAAYEIVCWTDTEIEVNGAYNPREARINSSLNSILMDSCRIQDEKQRDANNREAAAQEEVHTEAEVVEDFELEMTEPESVEDYKPAHINLTEDTIMSVQDKLKEFTALEGFAGVGVFTPSGESLGMLAADKVNLKEIGVLANNVLMNAQKASLDMGTGRGQLVHVEAEHANILVRCLNEGTDPLRSQPGKAHIHLVLILTSEAALGLAKMRVAKIIESLAEDFRM